ncbi:hypothetical protein [Methylobacterium oxalidis]|uniref:Uncharacterized protein n=1 Tax=Methylobacterium oxalidis TaxID=944322 RepID=A0A512J3Z6_9HYPH|nr:hypothetical protein [Methylobacterium oxalidis]GEP04674.1 hypothetical protein MOX02_27120 [Methylobacterium oxalidis]GJE32746.1 hypothetical protein LDDCCGHA_2935 [Methylobacterium oxalidis]GLS63271.1 hypothetical protein GCM10007888_16520 [Methylobacterium oxalidis]
MRTKTLAIAAGLMFAVSGAALAQTTAPDSAQKNLNNPGSVKSNAEKGMPERDAPAATGTTAAPGAPTVPGATAPSRSTTPNPAEPTPRR